MVQCLKKPIRTPDLDKEVICSHLIDLLADDRENRIPELRIIRPRQRQVDVLQFLVLAVRKQFLLVKQLDQINFFAGKDDGAFIRRHRRRAV